MMNTIVTAKKTELLGVLQKVPQKSDVNVQEYLNSLLHYLKHFQLEVEWNIQTMNSYSFSIDYLTKLIDEFKCLYVIIDGTFELIIFPEIIEASEYTRMHKIKSYIDTHKFIYLRTVSMLQKRESIINIKITHKIPIVENKIEFKSKYLLKDKNIMNVIEIGYTIYQNGNIISRNGDPIQLHQFIKDVGEFVGQDMKNIFQRIEEMKNRSNPHKFIDKLQLILKNE